MDYNEIQAALQKSLSAKASLTADIERTKKELEEVINQRNAENIKYRTRVETARETELKAFKDKLSSPYESQLKSVVDQIKAETDKYDSVIKGLTIDKIESTFSDKKAVQDELKSTLDKLSQQLGVLIGSSFRDELFRQLDTKKIVIEQEDLKEFILYFNNLNIEVGKMLKKQNKDSENKFKDKISALDVVRLISNKKNLVLVSSVGIILFIVFTKYVLPFYLMVLMLQLIINCKKSYRIYEIILAYKSIDDNVSKIEDLLREQEEKEVVKQKKREKKKFDLMMQKLNAKEEELKDSIEKAKKHAEATFVFDGAHLKESHDIIIVNTDNRIRKMQDNIKGLESALKEAINNCEKYSAELKRLAELVPKKYLRYDAVGENVIFDGKFLFDLKENKPIFFQHPKRTSVYLYDDTNVYVNFIKLITVQLRGQMSPFSFDVSIMDKKFMGTQFQVFVPEKKDKFSISVTDKEILDKFDFISESLMKRVQNIMSSFSSIEEYNEMMLKSESVTESYIFIFLINPDEKLIGNDVIAKLNSIGGSVGVYLHIFSSYNDFIKMNKAAIDLIKDTECVYKITDESVSEENINDLVTEIEKKNSNKKF